MWPVKDAELYTQMDFFLLTDWQRNRTVGVSNQMICIYIYVLVNRKDEAAAQKC